MDLTKEALDREFPSRRRTIQMNHAAVSPLPARGADALIGYARRTAERGALDWRAWAAEARRVKELAATLIGAPSANDLSIVPNTTWGLNLVAQGFDWAPGDNVVTTASEFPSNLTPWLALERLGVTVRRLPTRDGAFTADEIAALSDARTRIISVSAVAFHTGFRAPFEATGAFCRERGIVFGLDGIQAVGAVPIDVTGAGVDFLSADGHKWMLGPEGCGILFTTPDLRARLRAPAGWANLDRPLGVLGIDEPARYLTSGAKLEVGAPPTPGVYALSASLALLLSIGGETVAARIARTLAVLVEGLPGLGFEPVLFDGPPRSGILAARPPAGRDARDYWKRLDALGIVTSAREGFLRLSPHVGNDEAEAERVLHALRG